MSIAQIKPLKKVLFIVRGVMRLPDGRVIMVKKAPTGSWIDDEWHFPGGKVADVDLLDLESLNKLLPRAMRREFKEETGIAVRIKRIIGGSCTSWQGVMCFGTYYEVEPRKPIKKGFKLDVANCSADVSAIRAGTIADCMRMIGPRSRTYMPSNFWLDVHNKE